MEDEIVASVRRVKNNNNWVFWLQVKLYSDKSRQPGVLHCFYILATYPRKAGIKWLYAFSYFQITANPSGHSLQYIIPMSIFLRRVCVEDNIPWVELPCHMVEINPDSIRIMISFCTISGAWRCQQSGSVR